MGSMEVSWQEYEKQRRRLNAQLGLVVFALLPLAAILIAFGFSPLRMLLIVASLGASIGILYPMWWRTQVALIRPYRKNPMKTGEEKLRFDTLSDDGQGYVASFYVYVTPAMAGELHRQNGYRVRFNDDPSYPQILELLETVPLPKPPAKNTKTSP